MLNSYPTGATSHLRKMTSSLRFLSAFAFGGAALLASPAAFAQSIPMGFDCFDRSSGALIARSAADLTTPAMSCLPIPQLGDQMALNTLPMEQDAEQAHAEANVAIHQEQPQGPNIGEIILGAAVQEGFRALFGTYDRGDVSSNVTEIHNGNRCDGMGTICGDGNGVGDIGSGNASNSGNTSNSGNSSNSGNTIVRPTITRFPNITVPKSTISIRPRTLEALQNTQLKKAKTKKAKAFIKTTPSKSSTLIKKSFNKKSPAKSPTQSGKVLATKTFKKQHIMPKPLSRKATQIKKITSFKTLLKK